ncbi:MAG: hypothetical protein QOD63_842 [Actinomycetota bacterium]|jgi:hypothetical protein|nr:hypothetical protein [Actinomycetota bacterium]
MPLTGQARVAHERLHGQPGAILRPHCCSWCREALARREAERLIRAGKLVKG